MDRRSIGVMEAILVAINETPVPTRIKWRTIIDNNLWKRHIPYLLKQDLVYCVKEIRGRSHLNGNQRKRWYNRYYLTEKGRQVCGLIMEKRKLMGEMG